MSTKKKILCFDLDGVICSNTKYKKSDLLDYKKSKSIPIAVKTINKLYDDGHTIIIYTARGMTRYKGNVSLIKKKLSELTINSLKSWNLKYHKLVFGKIYYDLIIDDKSINYKSDWTKNIFKKN